MRPALLLFYLAALMVKTDVTSDDEHDQEIFGAFLIFVLFVGPFLAIVEPFFDVICAATQPISPNEEFQKKFLSLINLYYKGKLMSLEKLENYTNEVLQKEKSNDGHGDSSREATPEQTNMRSSSLDRLQGEDSGFRGRGRGPAALGVPRGRGPSVPDPESGSGSGFDSGFKVSIFNHNFNIWAE